MCPETEPFRYITLVATGGEKSSISLTAEINEKGDLVFEGYDIGDFVEEFWGDSDYEYWLTVKAEYVPAVLLLLIKERFKNDIDFRKWLDTQCIPNEFFSWV